MYRGSLGKEVILSKTVWRVWTPVLRRCTGGKSLCLEMGRGARWFLNDEELGQWRNMIIVCQPGEIQWAKLGVKWPMCASLKQVWVEWEAGGPCTLYHGKLWVPLKSSTLELEEGHPNSGRRMGGQGQGAQRAIN